MSHDVDDLEPAPPSRPDRGPLASASDADIARIAARFEAADPKWHKLCAELKRRYPKTEIRRDDFGLPWGWKGRAR